MYELLFRSRWYALAWAVFMAASALMFTTIGAGAWITSPGAPTGAHEGAGEEQRDNAYRSWAEDDKRRMNDETGFEPSSPETLRDGIPPRTEMADAERRGVPFANGEDEEQPGN